MIEKTPSPDTDTKPVQPDGAPEDRRGRGLIREVLETVLIAVAVLLLIRGVVLTFKIDGPSMQPTFHSGEMVLANRNAYRELDLGDFVDWLPGIGEQHWLTIVDWGTPQRGDVVILYPPDSEEQKPYIKRVIAVAGDEVVFTADRDVYVNGERLDEPYIGDYTNSCVGHWEYCSVTVPAGHVFVVGDNRNNSSDSRRFGPVPEEHLIGKAWFVVWPLREAGPVEHPDLP